MSIKDEELDSLASQGFTVNVIALRTGKPVWFVVSYFKNRGGIGKYRNSFKKTDSKSRICTDEQISMIIAERNMGFSLRAIGERYGISRETVRAYFKQYGEPQISGFLAEVVEDKIIPNAWRVEKFNSNGDGGVDVTIFCGPKACERAAEYAIWKYR